MKSLFLVGYMGAGKTTVAKELSMYYGFKYIDLDLYIEKKMRQKIEDVFKERGEDGFRIIERICLGEIADQSGVVVALGGGTPCFFDNMSVIKRAGTTVFLRMKVENLFKRLSGAHVRRPLLTGKSGDELYDFIKRQLEQRTMYYSKSDIIIDADGLSSEEIVNKIVYENLRKQTKTDF